MTDEVMREKHQQQGKSWWSGMKNSIVSYASSKIMGAESTDGGAEKPSKTSVPDKVRNVCVCRCALVRKGGAVDIHLKIFAFDKISESVLALALCLGLTTSFPLP